MPTNSIKAYETHAQAFMQARDVSTIGVEEMQIWCRSLRRHATVLELACGAGYPVTRVLIEAGLRVWAIDSSAYLLREFERRFPAVPVQCATVQESDFFGMQFDAVVAVGLMFLLSEVDQIRLIERIAKVLLPGGYLLFTAPVQACQWQDLTTGVVSTSLGQEKYEAHLSASGMRLTRSFVDAGGNHYFEAQLFVP